MTPAPYTIEAERPVAAAMEMMESLHIRHLPVVRKGQLVGLVSDRDLRSHAPPDDFAMDNLGTTMDLMDRAVAQVMTPDPKTVAPNDSISEAVDAVLEWRIGSLCVVHGERLVGIVSQLDLLRALRPFAERLDQAPAPSGFPEAETDDESE